LVILNFNYRFSINYKWVAPGQEVGVTVGDVIGEEVGATVEACHQNRVIASMLQILEWIHPNQS
jgi:hypothetical protein